MNILLTTQIVATKSLAVRACLLLPYVFSPYSLAVHAADGTSGNAKTPSVRANAAAKSSAKPPAKATTAKRGVIESIGGTEIIEAPNATMTPAAAKQKEEAARAKADQPTEARVREYDEIFSDANITSGGVLMLARAAVKNKQFAKAAKLCERGLKMDEDDIDIHLVYAEALEGQLRAQNEKDPALFRKVVERWLMVMRNQVGEEKGLDYKGISFLHGFYADEERGIEAKQRLIKLTGYAPKMLETNDRYLRRVLKPATATVTAVVRSVKEQEALGKGKDEPVKKEEPGDKAENVVLEDDAPATTPSK